MSDIMSGQIPLLPRDGEQVGAGVILGLISTGGFATVYETWLDALELRRAVKVMHPDADSETRERMLTEARILSQLVHPNIVHVYNYGETATGLPFLEMDFVNGVTLEELIKKHGSLPLPVAFAAAAAMLEALHYAHTIKYTLNRERYSGVVHRDIKPANVMVVAETGYVKLMDFGIARPMGISLHTVPGTAPGTLNYMSPEAYADGNSDTRSDIYQIGLLLYECICGRAAFPQTNRMALNDARAANTYKPINTHGRADLIEAAAIIDKCLRLDPDERYQTAQDCLADVRALCSALCPRATPEQIIKSFLDGTPLRQIKPKRNYAKLLKKNARAATVVLAAAAAIVAVIYYSPRIIQSAAKVFYAKIQSAAPAPDERAMTAARETETPTPQKQNAVVEIVPPQQPRKTDALIPVAAVQAAADKTEAVDDASNGGGGGDSALTLISHADILFADKKYSEALNTYQKAIITPSTSARREVIKKALYGSARCNTALFLAGQTTRSNYVTAWRSVANAYPPDSPQGIEAKSHLTEDNQ
jgi:tRNA A-37 threonylcarbamoyl transferase component Bud32/tetratricopeptide (TPR) repeat protein